MNLKAQKEKGAASLALTTELSGRTKPLSEKQIRSSALKNPSLHSLILDGRKDPSLFKGLKGNFFSSFSPDLFCFRGRQNMALIDAYVTSEEIMNRLDIPLEGRRDAIVKACSSSTTLEREQNL